MRAKNALGIIMASMGHDSATGLLTMKMEGAQTIAQDETSSVVLECQSHQAGRGRIACQLHIFTAKDAAGVVKVKSLHEKDKRLSQWLPH